jgi:hypothetical protein
VNVGPFAELVDQIEKEDHALCRVGDEMTVFGVSLAGKL